MVVLAVSMASNAAAVVTLTEPVTCKPALVLSKTARVAPKMAAAESAMVYEWVTLVPVRAPNAATALASATVAVAPVTTMLVMVSFAPATKPATAVGVPVTSAMVVVPELVADNRACACVALDAPVPVMLVAPPRTAGVAAKLAVVSLRL